MINILKACILWTWRFVCYIQDNASYSLLQFKHSFYISDATLHGDDLYNVIYESHLGYPKEMIILDPQKLGVI